MGVASSVPVGCVGLPRGGVFSQPPPVELGEGVQLDGFFLKGVGRESLEVGDELTVLGQPRVTRGFAGDELLDGGAERGRDGDGLVGVGHRSTRHPFAKRSEGDPRSVSDRFLSCFFPLDPLSQLIPEVHTYSIGAIMEQIRNIGT